MHFSCKITNAILTDLDRRGEDLSCLYDSEFPPMEVVRDPSQWMSAPEMEHFLKNLEQISWTNLNQNLFVEAGHSSPKNHAWGVLDSVLRMMPRPQEIFHQPERFLSYFISPEPPIENLRRTPEELSFDLPLPAEQYPRVSTYLKAAFEALPVYSGHQRASCEWTDIHLKMKWSEQQESIFHEVDPGRQISQELLQSVINDHQRILKELEEKNLELQKKDLELERLKMNQVQFQEDDIKESLHGYLAKLAPSSQQPTYLVEQNLARLHDYMVRAQQLITLLVGFSKKEPGVKEALKRLDWDQVRASYPRTIAESFEILRKSQNQKHHPDHRHAEADHHV